MTKVNKNYNILGVASVALVLFLVLAYFVLSDSGILFNPRVPGGEPSNITGTGLETNIDPTVAKEMEESSNVMLLLKKIPYYGKNFAFFYSFDGNYFILYINPSNPTIGNAEFNSFLKENNIDNKSSIYDLREVSIMPTPEP